MSSNIHEFDFNGLSKMGKYKLYTYMANFLRAEATDLADAIENLERQAEIPTSNVPTDSTAITHMREWRDATQALYEQARKAKEDAISETTSKPLPSRDRAGGGG